MAVVGSGYCHSVVTGVPMKKVSERREKSSKGRGVREGKENYIKDYTSVRSIFEGKREKKRKKRGKKERHRLIGGEFDAITGCKWRKGDWTRDWPAICSFFALYSVLVVDKIATTCNLLPLE